MVYLVKGKLTTRLASKPVGDCVAIWGPLGNAFSQLRATACNGGCVDRPDSFFASRARSPWPAQVWKSLKRVRSESAFLLRRAQQRVFAGASDFESQGVQVSITTDDGSLGPARRVTDALTDILDQSAGIETRVVCCGPEPMMEAVAHLAQQRRIACEVSLETPMACGIGICFTCVAKVGSESDWDYKRTCVEGPVFDASKIVW